MKTLEPVLAEHPFFQGLDPQYLKLMAGCAKNVRFEVGEYIFHQGEQADQFYIIRHGDVALEIDAAQRGLITVDTVSAGGVLGWSWLMPPYRWRAGAQALTLVRAISLDGKCLRKKCETDHSFGYELLTRFFPVLVERLEHTRLQLLDIYGAYK